MGRPALLSNSTYQSLTADGIVKAEFYIRDGGSYYTNVDIHAIQSNTTWTETTATWNNLSSYSSTVYATSLMGGGEWECFDITSLVKAWKNGTENGQCGFMMVIQDESTYIGTLSCEYGTGENWPYAVITCADDQITVNEGGTATITVSNPNGLALTWTSDDTSIATVSASGVVTGVNAGMTHVQVLSEDGTVDASYTVYVRLPDGLYYLKNASSGQYLTSTGTQATGESKYTGENTKYYQMWKIAYVASGRYAMRLMYDTSMVLTTDSSADVAVNTTTASNSTLTSSYLWTITRNSTGYYFQLDGDTSQTLKLQFVGNTSGIIYSGTYSTSSYCHWSLEEVKGIFLRDTATNEIITSSTVKYMELGETLTLAQLMVAYETHAAVSGAVSLTTSDSNVVTIDTDGVVSGIGYGFVQITFSTSVDNVDCSAVLNLCIRLPDGAYYLTNSATKLYIDISGPTMADGTTVYQWGFHGGDAQRWTITYLSDGYYTIKSSYASSTAYYLGIADDLTTPGADVELRSGTITNGMKWRIQASGNGSYKLIAKTGISNGYVLSAATSSTTNGSGLVQRAYINDSIQVDEWVLYPQIDYTLMFIGDISTDKPTDSNMIPIVNSVDTALRSEDLVGTGYTTLNISDAMILLTESSVVSTIGHGNQNVIQLSDGLIYSTDIDALSNNALERVELIYLGACSTGQGGTGASNLVNSLANKGATTVIGFADVAKVRETEYWTEQFMLSLASGATIEQALAVADNALDEHDTLGSKSEYSTGAAHRYIVGPIDYNPWNN